MLSFSFKSLEAQNNVSGQAYSDNWTKGHDLFKRKDFGGARFCFQLVAEKEKEFSDRKIGAEFYLASCALELSRLEAEKKMLRFLDRYPGNIYMHQAYFQLARQKYKQEKYTKAIGWLDRTDAYQVEQEDEDEFLFIKGYSYFKINDLDQAVKCFFDLIDKRGEYQLSANYYYAHIAYENGNYETALKAFDKLVDVDEYSSLIPYYMTQIYFLQEKYDKLLEYAPKLLKKKGVERVAEISKMIGLAYYNQKDYSNSILYLNRNQDDLNRKEIFALAFSYYKEEDYRHASQLFPKIKNQSDSISQISNYNLADCFLKLNEKGRAKEAFKKAAAIDADELIKKSALFNFAKISYELSITEVNETISAFDDYLTLYPNSDENDEAYDFLVSVYMRTKSYEQALLSMDKILNKSSRLKEAYQRVAYFYALELFKNSKYEKSLQYLNKSLVYKIYDRDMAADCLYWKAETYYRTSDFIVAIKNYQEFLQTPGAGNSEYFNNAYYNLGYCEFELDSYSKAIKWFRKYEQLMAGETSEYLTDVQNRIGDCYFLDRNYDKASEYYSKAAAANNWSTDYAVYQDALSEGLMGQVNKKIALLKNFSAKFVKSDYKDDALFELAKAKIKNGNEDEALSIYNNLILEYPHSEYLAKSLLQIGQLNYNKKTYPESIRNYKLVILDYPNSSESKSALMGLKNVYIDMNNVQAYFVFAESLGTDSSVNTSEKDSLTYLSAERLYMDGENEKSTRAFAEYLKDFPNGLFRINAAYYKGESAFNREDYTEALNAFKLVLETEDNLFTEKALLGVSQIYHRNKDYSKARAYFQMLKLKATINENKLIANWGLFRCYYELKNYSDLLKESEDLLLSKETGKQGRKEILYKRAKAYLAIGDDGLAKNDLVKLAKEVQSVEGAESRFLLADLLYRTHNLVEAEKLVNEFIDMNSPHHYWLGKSFILLSDIFVAKNDLFQARYTLKSVIDNYVIKDDGIIEAAMVKLKPIQDDKDKKESDLDKEETKPTQPKALKKKNHIRAGSLSVNDVKSMLNEMVGELED